MTEVEVRQLKPMDVWKQKESLVADERKSLQFWLNATDDERTGILLLVQEQLLKLVDKVGDWVPTSLKTNDGDRLDVQMSLYLPEVSEASLQNRVDVARKKASQVEELLEMHKDLS